MLEVKSTAALAAIAAVTVGCGSSSSSASGPVAKFNSCIGRTAPGLSASGQPAAGGATEPIVDQLNGIVGNVWLYGSHAEAAANAKVMTGYPVRIVRGAYLVDVNQGVGSSDTLAIQSCAAEIPTG